MRKNLLYISLLLMPLEAMAQTTYSIYDTIQVNHQENTV